MLDVFFSSRRRHTRLQGDWSSDVCSSDLLVLSEIPDGENLWLISTGTGIGPFLSILKSEAPWQRFRQVVLVHAVRHAEELSYRDSIERLLGEHGEQMRTVSFVSRENKPGALHGRIPLAIEEGRLEAAAGVALSAKTSQVMICGNPEMGTDTSAALARRGMKKHRRRGPGPITGGNYWGRRPRLACCLPAARSGSRPAPGPRVPPPTPPP